jgi:hypothetical protein
MSREINSALTEPSKNGGMTNLHIGVWSASALHSSEINDTLEVFNSKDIKERLWRTCWNLRLSSLWIYWRWCSGVSSYFDIEPDLEPLQNGES